MLLCDRLRALIRERGLSVEASRRIEAALRTLDAAFGALDVENLCTELKLAQQVSVPGDDAVYIVTGDWGDGTYDLIREQGSFPRDTLIGWMPGQPLPQYKAELAAEPLPELPKNAKKPARPLHVHAAPESRARR